jgi:hypothetical protein
MLSYTPHSMKLSFMLPWQRTRGKETPYPDRRLGVSHSRYGRDRENEGPSLTESQTPVLEPVASQSTDCAIPTDGQEW